MAFLAQGDSSSIASEHESAPDTVRDPQERQSSVPLPRILTASMILGQLDTSGERSGNEVFCVRYSPDGQFIAGACGNGDIKVYSCSSGKLVYQLPSNSVFGSPTCCIRFRPNTATSKTRNVLLAVNANGEVKHWHMTSMKCLHTISEEPNQVYALDYRHDGLKFATAGQDYKVRLYDEATKTLQSTLTGGYGRTKAGHSNRVFSLKFSAEDENMLISAGWDNTIQVWDIRTDVPVRSCFGPHVTGDSVDLYGNLILSGSWRPDRQLQLWDLRTCALIEDLDWQNYQEPCMLYAAQFSKDPNARHIMAGGSGSNEARLLERSSGKVMGSLRGMKQGVYSIDFHPLTSQVAVSSGDGTIRVVNYGR